MKLSRRDWLKRAAAAGAVMSVPGLAKSAAIAQGPGAGAAGQMAGAGVLPWEREMPLREAAKSTFVTALLPLTPQSSSGGQGGGTQMSNLEIRTAIWGPSHQVTLSLLKNDVWDRRISQAPYPKLKDVIENALAGAEAYKGLPAQTNRVSTRPNWNMLMADGSMVDPLRTNRKALMKVTGQIMLQMDELEGADQPQIAHCCANGVAKMTVAKGGAKADLEYVVSMTENVYAIRGTWAGLSKQIGLRVYRNHDTRNDGIEPSASGKDGRYFWVRQKLPAEKTFSEGFEFVVMGIMDDPAAELATADGQPGLGTPPPNAALRAAQGSAATASFVPKDGLRTTGYVVVVSTVDANGGDVMAEARKRLAAAAAVGFDGIAVQNAQWYGSLYDRRENGRTFYGTSGRDTTDNVRELFYSWFCTHGGCTKTDMRKYQASTNYDVPETEPQAYSGLPCYNEVFYTHKWIYGRGDAVDMWKQIVEHWMEASRKNAREVFDMPGMYITHGFLPPVKADIYVHTNFALEFALETMAQVIKTVWDEWDYQGDEKFLRETCYPMMREMCLFYAAYAKKGDDGMYHIIPCNQEESWGFFPGLSHNKDCIADLCMFKWAFLRATEAAKLLGRDADLWPKWMEIAENLAPYPTWQKEEGMIFAGLPGVEPWRGSGEHPWDVGCYPTLLADEINLDSDEATKEMMARTVTVLQAGGTAETLILLGRAPAPGGGGRGGRGAPASPATAGAARGAEAGVAATGRAGRGRGAGGGGGGGGGARELSVGGGWSPERLLNSRSGRIHLFPCATGAVAFRRYQARGGFLVSACRDDSGVTYVQIESRRNVPCKLMNPWPGKQVSIRDGAARVDFKLDATNGECLVFDAQADHGYRVSVA